MRSQESIGRSANPFTRMQESDPLLGQLATSVAAAERPAVIALEIDGLNAVGVRHGEEIAAWALQVTKHRLAAASVHNVLGRFDEEKFVVLMRGYPTAGEASELSLRLQAAVRSPMRVARIVLRVSASAGIALRPGAMSAELLHLARRDLDRSRRAAAGAARAGEFVRPGALAWHRGELNRAAPRRAALSA